MKRKRKINPRYKYHGICRHAEILGVTRVHLYKVLDGRRESRSLKARYMALVNKSA